MAARGRRRTSRPTVAGAVVALALLAGSCTSHDTQPDEADPSTTTTTTTDRPSAPSDPRLEEIAGAIGCSATTPVEPDDGFAGSARCEVGGRADTRIQIFEPSERASVEQRFSETFGDSPEGGVECGGVTYQYVVLGDDWLVATDDRAVAGGLVVNQGAGFIGPDGEPSGTEDAPDVCR